MNNQADTETLVLNVVPASVGRRISRRRRVAEGRGFRR